MRQVISAPVYFTFGLVAGITSPLISAAVCRDFYSTLYAPFILPGILESPFAKAGACAGSGVLVGGLFFAVNFSQTTAACIGATMTVATGIVTKMV